MSIPLRVNTISGNEAWPDSNRNNSRDETKRRSLAAENRRPGDFDVIFAL
jgi:hypothetical protein